MFDIQEELKKLPKKPGVYIMHDENDTIIYVGKAIILKNRVRSYFRESTAKTVKIQQMVKKIRWFEYVVTDSELEALVLENNLIKEHQPKYNTMLKDDKTYPYIKVTTQEKFPRIFMTREVRKDNAKYFGPFTSSNSVRDTIELLRKLYKIRTCTRNLSGVLAEENEALGQGAGNPCLYYHIGQCDAPCLGRIDEETYAESVHQALDFLNGNYKPLLSDLESKMQEASDNLDFERAKEYRDLLFSVRQVAQKQKITDTAGEDKDIIAMAKDEKSVIIQVFFVRNGKIVGREHFYMKHAEGSEDADIVKSFVMQFYAGTPFIPRELLVPFELEDKELIEQWLTDKRGGRMRITIPQKGKKEKLVELAEKNAEIVLKQDIDKIKREEARTTGAVREIEELLGLAGIVRMEAFDISNISGFESVGSMVVYERGKPKRNDYRKFRIKSVEGPNDYASMQEVLQRRFEHGLKEQAELSEKGKNSLYGKFTKFPDLLMMDGGRGQVNIAEAVLASLNLNIPVCGMVKDDNHRTRGLYYKNAELPISRSSEGFRLITRIQDEAHRFAIEYHRSLRSSGQVHSVLDDIPQIGAARRKALMKHFESIEELKSASVETLMEIPAMNALSAKRVYEFFHGKEVE